MSEHGSSVIPQTHLEALRKKHALLSKRVEEAQNRLSTTDFYLQQLKKQKLRIKEKMEGIRTETANAS